MKKLLITAAVMGSLAACAKNPDSIAPVSMNGAYDAMPCRDARVALSDEYNKLRLLTQQQKDAVLGDAIGVVLIGVPVSSLSGSDKAGLIAASKGKVLALETRVSKCGG